MYAGGLALVVVILLTWRTFRRPAVDPTLPHPPVQNWIVGIHRQWQTWALSGQLQAVLTSFVKELGPVFYVPMLHHSILIVSDPKIARAILNHPETYSLTKAGAKVFREMAEYAMVVLEGDVWKRHRRLLAPVFSTKQMRQFHDIMNRELDSVIGQWADSAEGMELVSGSRDITSRLITRMTLNKGGSSTAGQQKHIEKLGVGVLRRSPLPYPLLWKMMYKDEGEWREAIAKAKDMAVEVLKERVEERGMPLPMPEGHLPDMVDIMLQTRVNESGTGECGLGDSEIVDEILQFYLAGHSTTSAALMAAIYMLATNRESLLAVKEEVASACTDGAPPTYDQLQEMGLLEGAVKETLRMYPPIAIMGRDISTNCSVGGYKVSAGTRLMVNVHAVHRSPAHYADPDTFDPARWLEADSKREEAFLPFGCGPKMCLGYRLAMGEVKLVLARLVMAFDFQLADPTSPVPYHSLPLGPRKPVQLVLKAHTPGDIKPSGVEGVYIKAG